VSFGVTALAMVSALDGGVGSAGSISPKSIVGKSAFAQQNMSQKL
jgi:hypothetical protein